jgi:carboxymethylenebutenolidase
LALLAHLAGRADVDPTHLGAVGWCFGGHLALRAAAEASVRSAACCYATTVHTAILGASVNVDTLARAATIRGDLLLVWGRDDPHIPAAGRARIHRALEDANVRFEARLFDAEHAFMRDEGPRYDAAAADEAVRAIVAVLTRA